jgi:hypothetical protein
MGWNGGGSAVVLKEVAQCNICHALINSFQSTLRKLAPCIIPVSQESNLKFLIMKRLAIALLCLTSTLALAAKKNLIIDTDLFSDVE